MMYQVIMRTYIGNKLMAEEPCGQMYKTLSEAQDFLKEQFKQLKQKNCNPVWHNKDAIRFSDTYDTSWTWMSSLEIVGVASI